MRLRSAYKFEYYQDEEGKWRWRMKSRHNGQVVATSHQSYFSKYNARRAVRSMKRGKVQNAEVRQA